MLTERYAADRRISGDGNRRDPFRLRFAMDTVTRRDSPMAKISRTAAALAVLTALAAPTLASAQPYGYGSPEYQNGYNANGYDRDVSARDARADRRDYDARCRHDRRSSGNTGTAAGAVIGGASGALIGGSLAGGLIGAGVGAVAGHVIAKNRVHC